MDQPRLRQSSSSSIRLATAGLAVLAFLAAASAAWSLASPGSGARGAIVSDVASPVATAVAVNALLIVGLSARWRIAHATALALLCYMTATFSHGLVATGIGDPFRMAAGIVGAATLIVLVIDWRRYWRSPGDALRGSSLAVVDWISVVLYAVLTIVTFLLMNWVFYHATFGRVLPNGPSDLTVVVSGFAVAAIAAGGLLLPLQRLAGAVLAFGGLTVAFGAFASEIRAAGEVFGPQLFQLPGAGLALLGLVLLVRSSGR